MNKWNGKLKCIKDFDSAGLHLTKDKVYNIKKGVLTYDDGFKGLTYTSFRDFKMGNPDIGICLVELNELDKPNKPATKETLKTDWQIEQSKLAKYIMINEEVTISIPIDTPMGISFKHPEDEYDEEIGQALALKRLFENMNE